jgi:hypothetical protein
MIHTLLLTIGVAAKAQGAPANEVIDLDAPENNPPQPPKKVVRITEDQARKAGAVIIAPKQKAPKKPAEKGKVAQVPNGGKLKKPKLLEEPVDTSKVIDLDADEPLPPTEDPAPLPAPAPTVEAVPPAPRPVAPPPAPSPAPVAAAAPSPPPSAPETAKEGKSLGFLDGAIMPSGQGGMIFGWSPKGKEPVQVGRTTSWAGLSGGVGEESCHFDKKKGAARSEDGKKAGFCVIFEGRTNAYLDKDTVLMRDLFVGGRLHYGLLGMFFRLGAEEDVGETQWAFRPGSVVDPRVILRDTFGHPGLSPIGGLSIGKYVLLRAEGNPQKKFWGARVDLHLPIEFNKWFTLNFDLDAGARDAADEMGKVAKGGFGINGLWNLKPRGLTYDGKPLDWGKFRFSLNALFERQAELLKTEDVGKIQAPMHNAFVGQAGLSWTGPEKGPIKWQYFAAYYSYGRYFPIEPGYGGFSSFHVEQKTWFDAAQLGVSPFGAVAYGQNLKTVFKVPDLTSDSGKPYWIVEFGVRGTFNDVFQWFDGKWGLW